MKLFTELNHWALLQKKTENFKPQFSTSSLSNSCLSLKNNSFQLDFSRQLMDEEIIELLLGFAQEQQLSSKIEQLFTGATVNLSEQRAALHTALRANLSENFLENNSDIQNLVSNCKDKMRSIAEAIRSGSWLGSTGKPITAIVNIGIGGSDFGPRFCLNTCSNLAQENLTYRFISDIDPQSFTNAVHALNPETTLFIVSSKSFTTQETIYNLHKARAWLATNPNSDNHLIAVTAHHEAAEKFAIKNILPIWEWVGGRFSFCSAINLISCIALGYEEFENLLAGARSMDEHFRTTDFRFNIPVMMALCGIWNINFLHCNNLLFLIYAQQLELFVPYIQQLDMESNGKSMDMQTRALNYTTGPIIWGGFGNQAQHSYYQLLCQSLHKIAADFLSIRSNDGEIINALCHKKMDVLSKGVFDPDYADGYIAGGMPINHISLESGSPFCVGALIAAYEHKIFTQSVIWNINPFDQPGVESAKRFKVVEKTFK